MSSSIAALVQDWRMLDAELEAADGADWERLCRETAIQRGRIAEFRAQSVGDLVLKIEVAASSAGGAIGISEQIALDVLNGEATDYTLALSLLRDLLNGVPPFAVSDQADQ